MNRIVVYTRGSRDIESWRPWLEQNYEVTYISTDQALLVLLDAWRPDLLIYHESQLRPEFLKAVFSFRQKNPMGIFVVASSYNLREELMAFEMGADHFLLAASPTESIKARIAGVIEKNRRTISALPSPATALLPQKLSPIRFLDLEIFPDQNCIRSQNQTGKRVTPTQMRLLIALLQNRDTLLTREWLQDHVFASAKMSPRSIDAQIAKLKKIVPELRAEIVSIYGQGYLLKSDVKKSAA